MTEIEFKTLIDGTLSACFPETGKWLAGLPNRKDVLDVWRRELIDLEFQAAKLAVEQIHANAEPGPPAYEREQWPGFIRRAIGRRAERERKRSEWKFDGIWDRVTRTNSNMAAAYAAILRARAEIRERMADASPWEREATLATETERIAREMVK